MDKRPTAAGGFFLILAILTGFAIGAMRGEVVVGTMLGTLVGIVIAVVVWLLDRRRA